MKRCVVYLLSLSILCVAQIPSDGFASKAAPKIQAKELRLASQKARFDAETMALSLGVPLELRDADGNPARLVDFAGSIPLYDSAFNADAAISLNANLVRNRAPFNANGLGLTIGIWEFGSVQAHREFGTRVRNREATPMPPESHANHVAGTIGAAGIEPGTQGMAPAVHMDIYDNLDDTSELLALGSVTGRDGKLLLSNHSYGSIAGWTEDDNGQWTYYGELSENQSRLFGQYSARAVRYDQAVENAPYLLPFKSAGNDRDDAPPPAGTQWRLNGQDLRVYRDGIDPAGDGEASQGFDTIPTYGNAKNVITVGAVSDAVTNSERDASVVEMTPYSGWGPADDGRIKPDIVANGTTLYGPQLDNSYGYRFGTSMATANASGAAVLLQEVASEKLGFPLRASALKGLIVHTATDLGRRGPDYETGWGLMNTLAAAEMIVADAATPGEKIIDDVTLVQGSTYVLPIKVETMGPARVTICWTDPAGTAISTHNSTERALVNDLDVRVRRLAGGLYTPYRLNPTRPTNIASLGDNRVDNTEQVYIARAFPGDYEIEITHKGTLQGGSQIVSLFHSGFGQATAPAPTPTPTLVPVVQAPGITSASSVIAAVGVPFSYRIAASNQPTGFSLAGILPAGLQFNAASGIISGTPTVAGRRTLTVGATNAGGTGFRQITLTTYAVRPFINSPSAASGAVGQPFSFQINALYAPTSYSVSGSLPAGLRLNASTGLISGTPTQAATRAVVLLLAVNSAGTGSRNLTITITTPPPIIRSATVASANVGQAFAYQITADNSPTSYGVIGTLPSGLSVNLSTGRISGTPTVSGSYSVTLRAMNAGGTGTRTLTINVAAPVRPVITSSGTVGGIENSPFSYQIRATGNPTSFAVFGALPTGVAYNRITGIISGTPRQSGVFITSLRAYNKNGFAIKTLTITIQAARPTITSPDLVLAVIGVPFNYRIAADNSPTSYGLTGQLPAGLRFIASSGTIVGTPTARGNRTVTLRATNASGSDTKSLTINPYNVRPYINSSSQASSAVGSTFRYQTTALYAPTSFSYVGGLPAGLTFNQSTGLISGVPTGPASSQIITLQASNSAGIGTRNLLISITQGVPSITSADSASGSVGTRFVYRITASNQPSSFSVLGGLPTGLFYSRTTGVISGTPAVAGARTISVRASNAAGTGSKTVVIDIQNAGQAIPYLETFAAGSLNLPGWTFESTTEGRIAIVNGALQMDDTTGNGVSALNMADLSLNLSGKSDVTLEFVHTSLNDEHLELPATFQNVANGDGVAMSVDDGANWFRVASLAGAPNNATLFRANLSDTAAVNGLTLTAKTLVRFQQIDNYYAPSDGRRFDNVRVFEAGKTVDIAARDAGAANKAKSMGAPVGGSALILAAEDGEADFTMPAGFDSVLVVGVGPNAVANDVSRSEQPIALEASLLDTAEGQALYFSVPVGTAVRVQ